MVFIFFISCHLLAEPNQSVCSLSSSTHHGTPPHPPTVDPFTTSSSTHSSQSRGGYYFSHFHTVFRPHSSFLCLFFPTPPLPLFCPPPHTPPSWIFFGPGLLSCVLFIPCLRIVACRPPEPFCVVCSRTGAARAKCQAPSCCLHLPQWPAQCPSLCPTLNPTARPLMADSPRPHLCVSDPLQRLSEPNHSQQRNTNNNQKLPGLSSESTPAIVLLPTPRHCSSCVSNISPPETTGRLVQDVLWRSAKPHEARRPLLVDFSEVHHGSVPESISLCGLTC